MVGPGHQPSDRAVDPTGALGSLDQARTLLVSGCLDGAAKLAALALDGSPTRPGPRAAAELVAGQVMGMSGRPADARDYLVERAAKWVEGAPDVAALMHVEASIIALLRGDVTDCLAQAVRAHSLPGRPGASGPGACYAGVALLAAQVANGLTERSDQLASSTLRMVAAGIPTELPLLPVAAATALVRVAPQRSTAEVIDALDAALERDRAAALRPWTLALRALMEHRRCSWGLARSAAAESLELALDSGQHAVVPYARAALATAEAIIGPFDSCRRRCVELLGTSDMDIPVVRLAVLSALGLAEMGQGRMEEAVRWFEVLASGPGPVAKADPGLVMWAADLVEAYVYLGRRDRAAQVLERLEEHARATSNSRAGAAVIRCRALVSEAAGSADGSASAEELYQAALDLYRAPEWRFARARTELARGASLARRGDVVPALQAIGRAESIFVEIGAGGWAEQAACRRAALDTVAAGADMPFSGVAEVPDLEQDVVLAAALGATVADIAEGMLLTEGQARRVIRAAVDRLESAPRSDGGQATAPPLSEPGRYRIRMLGGFEIVDGVRTVKPPAGVAGMAVKLVALRGRVPTEELMDALWPDASGPAARQRLRSLLNRIRTSAGPLIERQGDWVALSANCDVDVRRFEEAARAATSPGSTGSAVPTASNGGPITLAALEVERRRLADDALEHYRGDLLPSDRYMDFTISARERLRRMYRAVVAAAVDAASSAGDVDRAVLLLEDVMASDPYDEESYTQAARVLERAGRRAEALSMLRRAESMLADLGLQLSPAGREIEARCRLARPGG